MIKVIKGVLYAIITALLLTPVGFTYVGAVYLFTGEKITIIAKVGSAAELLIIPPIMWLCFAGVIGTMLLFIVTIIKLPSDCIDEEV